MRRAVLEIMVAGMVFAASLGGAIAHQISLSGQVATISPTTMSS